MDRKKVILDGNKEFQNIKTNHVPMFKKLESTYHESQLKSQDLRSFELQQIKQQYKPIDRNDILLH